MDVSLLGFMNRQVRIKNDITHQEYKVAGINWDTGQLLLLGDGPNFWCDNQKVVLIPEGSEEDGWYPA